MAPPILNGQKSTLLNKLSESDHAPSTQALPLRKSSGDQNVPQPKVSADQNVPRHQKATCEVAKRFMEAIIFTKTPWPILSNIMYLMIEEAWKLAIEAQDHQRASGGAPVGTPSFCELPGSPSLKIDPQTREAVSHGFCVMRLYQISDIDYIPKYTSLKLKMNTIQGSLADGAHRTVVHSYQFDLRSETEIQIQVKELHFDDAYLSKVVDDRKSWFMWMDVLDLIYHQFSFTANSLGHQPMTSQYFQPLTPQTLALAAAALHCVLSEYAGAKKGTVTFSQDEFRGTFCPSPVINFTPEATALIHNTTVGRLIPTAVQNCEDRRSSIPGRTPRPRLTLFYFIPHLIPTGAPRSDSSLLYWIQHSLPHTPSPFGAPPLVWGLLKPRRRSSAWTWWLLPFFIRIIIAFQTPIQNRR